MAPKLGPKLEPSCDKIHFQVDLKLDLVSEEILEHLGLDFGEVWGAKIESERELKIRAIKT